MSSILDLVKAASTQPGNGGEPRVWKGPTGGDATLVAHYYRPQQWGPDLTVHVYEFSRQEKPAFGHHWKQVLVFRDGGKYADVYRFKDFQDPNPVHVTTLERRDTDKSGKKLDRPFHSGPMDGLWYNLNTPKKADPQVSYTGTYVKRASQAQSAPQAPGMGSPVAAAIAAMPASQQNEEPVTDSTVIMGENGIQF